MGNLLIFDKIIPINNIYIIINVKIYNILS